MKARPRQEEEEGDGLDSLLDTMTNVVGILVMGTAVFLLLPDRTWTFAFAAPRDRRAFVASVLAPGKEDGDGDVKGGITRRRRRRASAVVKEGWLNIGWGGSALLLSATSRRYCVVLTTGFVLLFRAGPTDRLRGFEEVVAVRDADVLRAAEPDATASTNVIGRAASMLLGGGGGGGGGGGDNDYGDETYGFDVVFDLVAAAEREVAAAEAAYATSVGEARRVQERLDKLEKRGEKIRAALAKKEALSERKRAKAEKAYVSYVEKLGTAQEELTRINAEAAGVKKRHDDALGDAEAMRAKRLGRSLGHWSDPDKASENEFQWYSESVRRASFLHPPALRIWSTIGLASAWSSLISAGL